MVPQIKVMMVVMVSIWFRCRWSYYGGGGGGAGAVGMLDLHQKRGDGEANPAPSTLGATNLVEVVHVTNYIQMWMVVPVVVVVVLPSTYGLAGDRDLNTGGGGGSLVHPVDSNGAGGSGIIKLFYPNAYTISNPGGGLTLSTATQEHTN